MFTRYTFLSVAATALLSAMQPAAAHEGDHSGPTLFDGHFYQVVKAGRISWEQAKLAAEERSYQGIGGHLATIGSKDEDEFVEQLRRQALDGGLHEDTAMSYGRKTSEVWVGGSQEPCVTDAPEPACGWVWLNGQPINETNGDSPYTNWLNGEPNNVIRNPDALHRRSEDFLAIGLADRFGWNDEGDLTNIAGYIVEYADKVTVDADSCTAQAGGCNPSGAQVYALPGSAQVAANATVTATSYVFHDDAARCGKDPLTLFAGAIVIPAYLCGHPDFIVIETDTTGVQVPTGTIDVENLTQDVLPENLYGCTKVRQNPAGLIDPDPSHRDVVAWQTTDPARMLESTLGTGRFLGSVTEVTYGCGSSRGKVVKGSFHFVGLRIHPGSGNEFADGNREGNFQSFVDLLSYKLQVLQASVLASKSALAKKPYQGLKCLIDKAIQQHNQGRYKDARATIRHFLALVSHTSYQVLPDQNFNGDHTMRASNIDFTYTAKLIPFIPSEMS